MPGGLCAKYHEVSGRPIIKGLAERMTEKPVKPEEPNRHAFRSDSPAQAGRGGSIPLASYALVGIGLEFLLTICLLGAAGWWLDGRLSTFPWLMIAGIAMGFAVGLARIIRAGARAFRK